MKKLLLEYLRCPKTGERLELVESSEDSSGEIRSGLLTTRSGARYVIAEGVPSMLVPEDWPEGQKETRDSFSWKWKHAPDYRQATQGHYVNWYLERYGFGNAAGLARFLSTKQRVLDAGTGHGRDAELFATNSNATVFGIDISYGIHNAYKDLGRIPNLHLVQADLTRLPFPETFFDFISCDQVIHHTPDTRKSFLALLKHLAPGGHIGIYVYKKKAPLREFADDYIRERTVKMSPEECLNFSESITKLGKALSDLHVQFEVPEDIPLLGIKAGTHDIQRFIYWNVLKCYWNDSIDWDSNVITNFDWYHPLHAHRHTPEEVRSWYEDAGLEVTHFDIVESGTSILGRRKA
jgi:SAM-dependent methyltransferase